MKMVKSLILGTAVAFAASAGAQAADLPVKAKPVSYVKICPQYGPGFYYVPGTDICLKVGGSAFAEVGYNQRNAAPFITWGAGGFTQASNYSNWRSRAYYNMDARNNSPYGTVRAVLVGGVELTTANNGLSSSAALAAPANGSLGSLAHIQWAYFQFAGFTFGLATSFYDFAPNMMVLANSSTPWGWNNLIAYTAQLGNGLSATISIEDPSGTKAGIQTAANAAVVAMGQERPDIVANVRLDQAWGSAQVMGAVKELRMSPLSTVSDQNGYAVGAGVLINTPMLGKGDAITFTANTARGAIEYTGLQGNPLASPVAIGLNGAAAGTVGNVFVSDAIMLAGVVTKTEATSFALQYRHYWTPTLRSAFHAGYTEAYNWASFGGFQIRQYGHALIWTPMAGLNFSLDVLYTETDVNNVSSDIVSALFRARRDF